MSGTSPPLKRKSYIRGAFKNGVGQSYAMILSYSLLLSYDLTIYLITTYFLMIFLCDWVTPLPPLHYAGWGDFFCPCLIIFKLFFDTISNPGRILVDSPAYIYGSTSELVLFLFLTGLFYKFVLYVGRNSSIGLAIMIMTSSS